MPADMSYLNEATYDQGDSQIWGTDTPKNIEPYDKSDTDENAFYDVRDDMVGGTDTQWTPDWSSCGDNCPSPDAAPWSVSGVLSQSDLAS